MSTPPAGPLDPVDPADPADPGTAAAVLTGDGGTTYRTAVVLGSGWASAAAELGDTVTEWSYADLPGFAPPVVAGHAGVARHVRVGGTHDVLVLLGRTHLYEGRGTAAVVHGVRVACAAGARTVVLTNAAGGIRADLGVGQPVLISDHLNLTATSPLVGPRFVDLSDLYSARLRAAARAVDPTLVEGVYAALPGPHYETPAEIRMLRGLGADLVGMSTALEAIAARAEGAEVLGLSLVTNAAAGMGPALDHADVVDAGAASAERIGRLLAAIVAAV